MSYYVNERCYKTLESAIAAYEEYKKNERILNGEGLAPLPRNLNFHTSNYVDFGPPGIPDAPIGTLYFDKHTNKMWMLNPEKRWVQMAHYEEYKSTAAKDNKKIINCRNCGAPIRSRVCEYCGSHY